MIQFIKNLLAPKPPTSIDVLTPQAIQVICPNGYAAYKYGSTIIVARNERVAKRIQIKRYQKSLSKPNETNK
jgi:hypothetical protein